MKTLRISGFLIVSLVVSAVAANGQATVTVLGTDDPWLADQPSGTGASYGDTAPADSPVLAGAVTPGQTITWSATGLEANGPGYAFSGPNGDVANVNGFGLIDHTSGAENGISDVLNVPIDSLMGVFVGATPPSGSAPAPLDFSSIGLSYADLTPLVAQVFYMGDGSAQSIVVPTGATALYLGPMDGFGWDNNPGSFVVTLQNVTPSAPDGASTAMLLGGVFGLLGMARRTSRN